uniref:Peptidase S1 domain-containing protein n=1 Tax=Steinernema glaseri TaxID=37863 RepID=A0A1I8AHA2_9BILA
MLLQVLTIFSLQLLLVAGSLAAPTSELIFGGQREYNTLTVPYQLLVFDGYSRCGAVLIHPRYALTAARCAKTFENSPSTRVWGGVSDIENLDPTRFQSRKVAKWIPHLYFDVTTMHNDIAIIDLEGPFVVMDTVKPIKISATDRVSDFPDPYPFMISGFGNTALETPTPYLHLADVSLVDWKTCRDAWDILGRDIITGDKMCTSNRHVGTLEGDSGCPLVHTHPDRAEWRLVGLSALGTAIPGYPDVYTRVSKHCVWIADTTNMDVICSLY